MEILKHLAWKIAALILAAFFVVNLLISYQESTTMDEKAHIPSAYSYVRYGDMRLNPEHPPLLKVLAGLPLLALDLRFPVNDPLWQNGINEQWVLGDKFINCTDPSGPDQVCNLPQAVTFWSRVPIVIVAALLGLAIFWWTRALAGPVAGLFALLLYAFDPNILGHSHYVTTDIGIAAFLFFAFYFFVRFLEAPTWKNVIWSGVFLGLAQLAKFSAVLIFPIFGLFALAYALTLTTGGDSTPWRRRLAQVWRYLSRYAVSVGICFILIWVLYFFTTVNMPGDKLDAIAGAVFPKNRVLGNFAYEFTLATSQHPLLKPFSEYFLGVFMVFARVAGGNTYYFLGTVSNHATPWYFPIVFLLKETLPLLFLLTLTALYTLYRVGLALSRERLGSWAGLVRVAFQSHIAQWLLGFFALFYAYVSITGNLNIGFRHLFPILPIIYVLVTKTLFDMLKRAEHPVSQRLGRILLGGCALVVVAIPVLSYPSYLSYFNAVAGGHANGYHYVTDSNYDWGQDVLRLNDFVENYNFCIATGLQDPVCEHLTLGPPPTQKPIDKIRVDYFGGSNPQFYLGNKYVSWHSDLPPEAGWYAVSAGFLQESIYKTKRPDEISYLWLMHATDGKPVARAGDSIFIFYVDPTKLPQ